MQKIKQKGIIYKFTLVATGNSFMSEIINYVQSNSQNNFQAFINDNFILVKRINQIINKLIIEKDDLIAVMLFY